MQALGELKWLGIFICAYNRRSKVIVLFSVSEDLDGAGGEEYPMDIWLLLASYIRPEDIVNFSLICKNAWTVTCTAAFWTRLYRRCDHRELTVLAALLISCCFWFGATPWMVTSFHFLYCMPGHEPSFEFLELLFNLKLILLIHPVIVFPMVTHFSSAVYLS